MPITTVSHATSSRSADERQEWLMLSALSTRWCYLCSVQIWFANNGHHDDSSSHLGTTKRNRSNSKKGSHLHPHKRLGAHNHQCTAVVCSDQEETTSMPRRLSTKNTCPIPACKPSRLHSGREDSIAQDCPSRKGISRQLPKTASLVVTNFSRYSLVHLPGWRDGM